MYRVKAVAEMFDVSVSTIYRAVESGQLDALKIGTGKGALRIPDYAIRAFRESCAEAAYRSYVAGSESAESADTEQQQGVLTPAQADGEACVVCGLNYRQPGGFGVDALPVGFSGAGSQVFACRVGCADRLARHQSGGVA
jgi:excisionase family DNA binding protein